MLQELSRKNVKKLFQAIHNKDRCGFTALYFKFFILTTQKTTTWIFVICSSYILYLLVTLNNIPFRKEIMCETPHKILTAPWCVRWIGCLEEEGPCKGRSSLDWGFSFFTDSVWGVITWETTVVMLWRWRHGDVRLGISELPDWITSWIKCIILCS